MSTTQERVDEQKGLETPGSGEEYRSLSQDVWRQFKKHKGAVGGLILLTIIVLATIFGPFLYGVDPFAIDTPNASASPSLDHPLGTDNLGRDVLARVLVGGRISISVGFAAMLVGLILGTGIGVIAGYFRKLDGPLMRVTDLFLALPILPLLLVAVLLFRDPLQDRFGEAMGIFILVVFIIGVTSWMQTARVVRGDVLSLKRVRPRRQQHRDPEAQGDNETHPPQHLEPGDGVGRAGRGGGHHHRVGPVVPGPRLPSELPHVGSSPLRRQPVHRDLPDTGDRPRGDDLSDRAERELHR